MTFDNLKAARLRFWMMNDDLPEEVQLLEQHHFENEDVHNALFVFANSDFYITAIKDKFGDTKHRIAIFELIFDGDTILTFRGTTTSFHVYEDCCKLYVRFKGEGKWCSKVRESFWFGEAQF